MQNLCNFLESNSHIKHEVIKTSKSRNCPWRTCQILEVSIIYSNDISVQKAVYRENSSQIQTFNHVSQFQWKATFWNMLDKTLEIESSSFHGILNLIKNGYNFLSFFANKFDNNKTLVINLKTKIEVIDIFLKQIQRVKYFHKKKQWTNFVIKPNIRPVHKLDPNSLLFFGTRSSQIYLQNMTLWLDESRD